jgi:hypothetical protein
MDDAPSAVLRPREKEPPRNEVRVPSGKPKRFAEPRHGVEGHEEQCPPGGRDRLEEPSLRREVDQRECDHLLA